MFSFSAEAVLELLDGDGEFGEENFFEGSDEEFRLDEEEVEIDYEGEKGEIGEMENNEITEEERHQEREDNIHYEEECEGVNDGLENGAEVEIVNEGEMEDNEMSEEERHREREDNEIRGGVRGIK